MFGMIPFDRSDNNIFDLFDNFEKQFFNNTNASLPASGPTSGTRATSSCWRLSCPASTRRTSPWT